MMFIDSFTAYLGAWLGAFTREGRRVAPLTSRRIAFLLLAPLGLLVFLIHGLCLALDNLFYRDYRKVPIRRPVFILGVPRSGTTYLHRELASDNEFVTTSSWEVVLAPSICQRRMLQGVSRIDRRLGAPLKRLMYKVLSTLSADVQAVHPIALDAAEEDYLSLLASAGCFFASLAFPQSARFRQLGRLSDLPTAPRRRLLRHYRGLLQRHLYAHGSTGQLLSKNAAFASWIPYLLDEYPDAMLVLCIREPSVALGSQLTSLESARRLFAAFPDDAAFTRSFESYYSHWFECLVAAAERPDSHSDDSLGSAVLVVEQRLLRDHPGQIFTAIYARLARELPARLAGFSSVSPVKQPSSTPAPQWRFNASTLSLMDASYARLRDLAPRQTDASAAASL